MILKNLMKNGIVVAAAVGAMALVGCGQGNGSNNNAAGGGGSDASDGADHASTVQQAAVDTHATGALDDSSAEGAINTYMNRLRVGDLVGAAEICVAEAPGTNELFIIGNNIEMMLADPAQASNGEMAKALFMDDLKTVSAVKTVEEDGVVVYEVSVLNKAPVNIRVELRDGAWRVIPPPGGMPFG